MYTRRYSRGPMRSRSGYGGRRRGTMPRGRTASRGGYATPPRYGARRTYARYYVGGRRY